MAWISYPSLANFDRELQGIKAKREAKKAQAADRNEDIQPSVWGLRHRHKVKAELVDILIDRKDGRANDSVFTGYFQDFNLARELARGNAISIRDLDPSSPDHAKYLSAMDIVEEQIDAGLRSESPWAINNRGRLRSMKTMIEQARTYNRVIDFTVLIDSTPENTRSAMNDFKDSQVKARNQDVFRKIVTALQEMDIDGLNSQASDDDAEARVKEIVMSKDPQNGLLANRVKDTVNRILVQEGLGDVEFGPSIKSINVFKGMSELERIRFEHMMQTAFTAGYADRAIASDCYDMLLDAA